MSDKKENIENARDPELLRRLLSLQSSGVCYFCQEGSLEENTLPKIVYRGKYWYITPNDFPLEGSVHHYLIVPIIHLVSEDDIFAEMVIEFYQKMIPWLKKHLGVESYSRFIRCGDGCYTGSTISHIHCHFIVGGEKPEGATLSDALPIVLGYKKR